MRMVSSLQMVSTWGVANLGQRRLFYTLQLLALLLGVAGMLRLVPDIGKPFGGFIWVVDAERDPFVAYDTPRHWSGPQAGLNAGDEFVAADETKLRDFYQAGVPANTTVRYDIRRAGIAQTVAVPTQTFTWLDLLQFYGVLFFMGLGFVILSVHLVRTRRFAYDAPLGAILLCVGALALFHGHGGVVRTFYSAVLPAALMWAPSVPLLGSFLIYFALVFPRPTSGLSGHPVVLWVIFGPGIGLAIGHALSHLGLRLLPITTWFILCALWLAASTGVATAIGVVRGWRARGDPTDVQAFIILGSMWLSGLAVLIGGLVLPAALLSAPLVPQDMLLLIVFLFPFLLALALMLVRSRQPLLRPSSGDTGAADEDHDATAILTDNPLHPREMEVLLLVERGMRNKEIAAALYITDGTVRTHLDNIRSRLGVRTRTAAVKEARKRGLFPENP